MVLVVKTNFSELFALSAAYLSCGALLPNLRIISQQRLSVYELRRATSVSCLVSAVAMRHGCLVKKGRGRRKGSGADVEASRGPDLSETSAWR